MSNEKVIKQSSVRYYEEDLKKIADLAKELDISTAEVVHEFTRAYDRISLEQTSSQGENLKTLRLYTDKINSLFNTMAQSTDEKVLKEQENALAAEKKFTDQVALTNQFKEETTEKIKEYQKQVKQLEEEVKQHQALEESTEARIKDKDEIIKSKDESIQLKEKTILQLSEELSEVKEASKSLKALEKENKILLTDKDELEIKLKQKDFEIQQAILNTKVELQKEYEKRTQDLTTQHQEQEKIRISIEKELREELGKASENHKEELNSLKAQYKEEIIQLEKQYKSELEQLQAQHKEEVASFEKKLDEAPPSSKTTKSRTPKKKEEN